MAGGTEAFPDLGSHCHHVDCNQLDFLPFTCDACSQVFCLEHRSYKSHNCPKSHHRSRKVVVCPTCSMSIETTGYNEDDEKAILQKHDRSGMCDPSKKKKPTCSVRRCKEVLTFSNTCTCKNCHLKVCLRHRFPADHACKGGTSSSLSSPEAPSNGSWKDRFLAALPWRTNGQQCSQGRAQSTSSSSTPFVKIF
ncbi:zinc finger AN1 domain-containing stress-associated protein 12-like [Neltuma alba]|uniref:zinc finger AN1 domain-containing stress-associated protein 12-like n=1 Tax=Neltuma alba TaxID=207710 RepID=UPI0010A4CCBD|nr:zinc finger AN1 domain-containing stress-associated protein 12-like [Prosopis alba]XP_028793122.1 zinc finger AN1 domain-containing stress-associated protein 12-like [Prosopis alba]